jgi:hypothetical protein
LVSDIPDGDGIIINFFLQCKLKQPRHPVCAEMYCIHVAPRCRCLCRVCWWRGAVRRAVAACWRPRGGCTWPPTGRTRPRRRPACSAPTTTHSSYSSSTRHQQSSMQQTSSGARGHILNTPPPPPPQTKQNIQYYIIFYLSFFPAKCRYFSRNYLSDKMNTDKLVLLQNGGFCNNCIPKRCLHISVHFRTNAL